MPIFGLLGCGSSNPCLFCEAERRRIGGLATWEPQEQVQLRSFGRLEMNYEGWMHEGGQEGANSTRPWKSVAAGHNIAEGVGDTWDTLLLDKAPPCPLHVGLLFTNDPINHLAQFHWSDFKAVLFNLYGIQPHCYQGKDRNYQGPEIRKMFSGIHKLFPLMRDDPIRKLYLDLFVGLKHVNAAVFGVNLDPNWRHLLEKLKAAIVSLSEATSFPITPKAHILMVHVSQWVERHGMALGKLGEEAGESLHHFWKRDLESQGEVKNKDSLAHEAQTLRVLVKFNSDNT